MSGPKKNPSFEIWLWVDKKTEPFNNLPQFIDNYMKNFSTVLADLPPDEQKGILNRIKFKDIEEEAVADKFVRYEIDRLRPNYGKSSDVLRYGISCKFGGAYFDSDVHPSEVALEDNPIFNTDFTQHHLYIDTNSQGAGYVGNDAIICTPGNPGMQQILTSAEINYTPQSELNNLFPIESRTYCYDGIGATSQGFVKALTIMQTGPSLVQTVLKSLPSDRTVVLPLNQFVDHAYDNDHNWLGIPTAKFERGEQNKVLDAINKTICFEIENMGMLRLDDHIANFAEALDIPASEAARQLLSKIDTNFIRKNVDKIHCAQLTLQYPETEKYYRQIGLRDEAIYLFNLVGNRLPINVVLKTDELKAALSEVGSKPSMLETDKLNFIITAINHGLIVLPRLIDNYKNALASNDKTLMQDDNASKYLQFLRGNLDIYQDIKQLHVLPPKLENQIDKLMDEVSNLQASLTLTSGNALKNESIDDKLKSDSKESSNNYYKKKCS